MDMVLYDSGPGDDRMILMACAELLDGLDNCPPGEVSPGEMAPGYLSLRLIVAR